MLRKKLYAGFLALLAWQIGVSSADREPDLRFIRLSREDRPGEDVVKFTLEYSASEKPDVTVTEEVQGYFEHTTGKIELTIPKHRYGYTIAKLTVSAGDASYILPIADITFDTQVSNLTEEIPKMQMEVLPGNDVTYQDGDNTTITTKVQLDMGTRRFARARSTVSLTRPFFSPYYGQYVRQDPVAFSEYIDEDRDVLIFASKPTPKLLHAQIMLKTAEKKLDGLVVIRHTIDFDRGEENAIMRSMSIEKTVDLYRADRDGPFPPGFVGFFSNTEFFMMQERTGTDIRAEKQICDRFRDRPCKISCSAIGSNPKSLEIVRVLDTGEETLVSPRVEANLGDTFLIHADYIIENVGGDDAGRYVCIAKTPKIAIRKTTQLEVYGI